MKKLYLLLIVVSLVQANATLFDDLNKSFEYGAPPTTLETRGYWSGYCVHYNDPFRPLASVYVYKELRNPNMLPYPYDSQSYFVKMNAPENYYTHYRPIDVERDPELRQWFDHYEPWGPVHYFNASFGNHFRHPQFDTTRMVRTYAANGKTRLILKVVPFNSALSAPYTLCYYTEFLGILHPGPVPVPTPEPIPAPVPNPVPTPQPAPSPAPQPNPSTAFTIGHSGAVKGKKEVELKLEASHMANTLIFIHRGVAPVTLRNVLVELPTATLSVSDKMILNPVKPLEISIGSTGEEIFSVSFDVEGNSDDIEVKAVLDKVR